MSDSIKMYTEDQLRLALLEQSNTGILETLKRLESNQKWMLGMVGSGFLGLLGLMAHGFKWIV